MKKLKTILGTAFVIFAIAAIGIFTWSTLGDLNTAKLSGYPDKPYYDLFTDELKQTYFKKGSNVFCDAYIEKGWDDENKIPRKFSIGEMPVTYAATIEYDSGEEKTVKVFLSFNKFSNTLKIKGGYTRDLDGKREYLSDAELRDRYNDLIGKEVIKK